MTPRAPWFPSLGAEAPLAGVQVRQTLALGLVPLGIALLLMAAGAPDWPAPGLWAGAGLVLGGMVALGALWRRAGGRRLRGYSTTHFLVRYLFIVLCPVLLWIVFGKTILALAGGGPPILLGLMLLTYPAVRILRERIDADPARPSRLPLAYIACRQFEIALGILALAGTLTGAILDANRDYPTDPAALLIVIWLLALLAVLACGVVGYAQGVAWAGPPRPPQALDDEPPPAAPPKNPLRFGSEKF